MKLYELFDHDLRSVRLANNGQARLTAQKDEKAEIELRAELETFVCEGQFAHAIQLILERYLGNLGHAKQDAAWISGFYGSGKSHLLKMLAHFWTDTRFADGSTARSMVRGGLPDEIQAHLRELDTQVRRTGLAAVAAAGTMLGGTDRVRETVLAIILRAAGWPTQYPQAKFCFWLRAQGHLDEVRRAVESAGKDWLSELNNLYVSPHLRKALLQVDPELAQDGKGVSKALQHQFPQLTTDITTAQFTETVREALEHEGNLPLTLVVLDEVQQYINEGGDRASIITEVAEALQTQLDSKVMLVGAGQSALSAGTQALMWLRDRFRISIELADADVETVIRKVLLRKKPSAEPAIESVLEANSGEIARHLRGTRVAERSEDRLYRVADYPRLPVRRRFWEACFQAVDAAGTHSQLRSQLRILHDALHEVAEKELGSLLPASDLFDGLAADLVNTGVLLPELNTRIQKLDDGTTDGRLRRNLCGLIFMISKLPRAPGVDLGVRATARTLADLMVDDIRPDSGPFRNRVADALESLADDGTVMKVGEEYRLQTTEGAEWDRDYREKQTSLRQNEVDIGARRDHLFGQQVQAIASNVKLSHGAAKLRRTLSLHVSSEPPKEGGDHVSVWLRDGWNTSEKDVGAEARKLGQEDPTLHVHLPKKSADDLKGRIIDAEAARTVLDHKGIPSTPEGGEARKGMESRLRAAEEARDEIVREVIRAAKVLQSGGNEVFGESLAHKLETGARSSLARRFPRFEDGDHKAWAVAGKRAREGNDAPFKIVDWDKPVEDHPVVKEVLAKVGSGSRGSDVQKKLRGAPYGWPQDAIDAALIALHRSGHLRAVRKTGEPIPVGDLDQAGVKAAEFRPEKVRLTTSQKIALRGLFSKAGLTTKSGDEERGAPLFLEALVNLAARAGGDAPLPAVPDTNILKDLGHLTGTEQLAALLEHKDDLEQKIVDWSRWGELAAKRIPVWDMVMAFRDHASALAVLKETAPELDAIVVQRSILADTNHVTPLATKLAGALREALTGKHAALSDAFKNADTQLDTDATWTRLDANQRTEIRVRVSLADPHPLAIASDDQLLAALEERSLSAWQAEVDAVPSRLAQALQEAARRVAEIEPEVVTTSVSIRRGTLADEAAVDAWLEEHGKKLKKAVAKGPVIVN